jgi:hypothetical protein
MSGKYIFHMADQSIKETWANSLEEALVKLGLTIDKPIGTEDGSPTTITLIEFDSKGQLWTLTKGNRK